MSYELQIILGSKFQVFLTLARRAHYFVYELMSALGRGATALPRVAHFNSEIII